MTERLTAEAARAERSASAAANSQGLENRRDEGAGHPFDGEVWATLVEEHRLKIAAVAGVEPSKVTIHIGH